MERSFKRRISALEEIFEFINEFSSTNDMDESVVFTINLAVEEIFTNMVKYNSGNSDEIVLHLEINKSDLVIHLTDFDVESFDITKTEEVDTEQSLQEKRVGGLGIHLVKKIMDKIDYEYKDRRSTITLIKHLEN